MRLQCTANVLLVILLSACATGVNNPAGVETGLPPDQMNRLSPGVPAPPVTGPASSADPRLGIESAAVPEGVDPELWSRLTAELLRLVEEGSPVTGTAQPEIITSDNRRASYTPYGPQHAISDLRITGNGPYIFTWEYRNSGDYDLNGEVNISDLTQIALQYGISSADALWPAASLVDGDDNGEVNISDITPIALNYQGSIIGYHVYGTNSLDGEMSYLGSATISVNLYKRTNRPFFKILFDSLDYKYYSLWPYDNSDDEGDWSNTTYWGALDPGGVTGVEKLW